MPDLPREAPDLSRIVLVGFMGAGKSTVGPLLARCLGWRYLDLDTEIERRTGKRVAEIFRLDGEAAFRALEAEATDALAGVQRLVLAPGGGWITAPENLERLGPGTLAVWLRVSAEEALIRLGRQGETRPLLNAPDPLAAARELLRSRDALYRRADLGVDTAGRTPAEIVDEILQQIRSRSRQERGSDTSRE